MCIYLWHESLNNQTQLDKKPINKIKMQKFQIIKISKNLIDFKKSFESKCVWILIQK